MVFEVDNTTEKLINELQESIRTTIGTLQQGQAEIKQTLGRMACIVDEAASAEQADSIATTLDKTNASIKQLATTELVSQSLHEIALLQSLVKENNEASKAANEDRLMLQEGIQKLSVMIQALSEQELNHLNNVNRSLQSISDILQKALSEISTTAEAISNNQGNLRAIATYLSLPGYKRFFKGMEALQDETLQ